MFLLSSEYDIIVGGLSYTAESSSLLYDFATPYSRDDLTWCVRAAEHVPGWLILLLTFHDWQTFFLTFVTYFVIVYLWYVYSAVDGTNYDIWRIGLWTYKIILAMSVPFKPRTSLIKWFFYSGSWGSGVLIIIFGSINSSYITVPLRFNQIQTRQEIIDHNIQLCGAIDAVNGQQTYGVSTDCAIQES